MFLCKKCHEEENCSRTHLQLSHGRCEVCNKTDDCVNCHAYRMRGDAETPLMDKNGNPVKKKVL